MTIASVFYHTFKEQVIVIVYQLFLELEWEGKHATYLVRLT